jgi:signal peptidase I
LVFVKIPKGHVWLEGDNKHDSHDSRYYGPVPSSMLQGRVVMRVRNCCNVMETKRDADCCYS